jgi:AcrR family transcriptional regulator
MQLDEVLAAAFDVFRERGYAEASLEQVATRARVGLESLRAQFADKDQLLGALLRAYSPVDRMEAALEAAEGEDAASLLRDALHRLVQTAQQHTDFFELALWDAQVNNGAFLSGLSARLAPRALRLLDRLKATGELRPVADAVLGRTLVALLIGFIASERMAPGVARFAMRVFPQRAWLDAMIDLLLYGVLEGEAR